MLGGMDVDVNLCVVSVHINVNIHDCKSISGAELFSLTVVGLGKSVPKLGRINSKMAWQS